MAVKTQYKQKHPERRVDLGEDNILRFLDEVNAQGREYTGCGVFPKDVMSHKEAWHKIREALGETGSVEKKAT